MFTIKNIIVYIKKNTVSIIDSAISNMFAQTTFAKNIEQYKSVIPDDIKDNDGETQIECVESEVESTIEKNENHLDIAKEYVEKAKKITAESNAVVPSSINIHEVVKRINGIEN